MRNTYIFFIICIFTIQMQSQEMGEWLDPVAITDSNSINSNPIVWLENDEIPIVFYEKKLDENSNSMIYRTSLVGDETEYPMLNDPETDYHQPAFRQSVTSDRAGFLIYLSNPNGQFELYASEYMHDGSLEKTFLLASEEEDIEHFSIQSHWSSWLGWNSNGETKVARLETTIDSIYLFQITLLDSLSCSKIKVNHGFVAWQKLLGDSIAVKYSSYDYDYDIQEWDWIAPVEIDRLVNEPNINLSKSVEMMGDINIISWVNGEKIKAYHAYDHDTMTYNTYDVPLPGHPSAFFWYPAVKRYFPELFFLCYDGEGWGGREIFCSQLDWGTDGFVQITQNDVEDFNPNLFSGEYLWSENAEYVYCIWQSKRNGKVPLYKSKTKADIGSGIEENKSKAIHIDVSPNPFSVSTQIAFKLQGNSAASLSIFSVDGQLVETKGIHAESGSGQHFNWHPKADLPEGIYIVTISQDGIRSSAKVIYK